MKKLLIFACLSLVLGCGREETKQTLLEDTDVVNCMGQDEIRIGYKDCNAIPSIIDSCLFQQDTIIFIRERIRTRVVLNSDSTITIQYNLRVRNIKEAE